MGWGRPCDEFTASLALLRPLSASLGMRFYSGTMFPREYRDAIFIADHGLWNRSKQIRGDIVDAKLKADGAVKSVNRSSPIFSTKTNTGASRSTCMSCKDGLMLNSDDYAGAIYLVT